MWMFFCFVLVYHTHYHHIYIYICIGFLLLYIIFIKCLTNFMSIDFCEKKKKARSDLTDQVYFLIGMKCCLSRKYTLPFRKKKILHLHPNLFFVFSVSPRFRPDSKKKKNFLAAAAKNL